MCTIYRLYENYLQSFANNTTFSWKICWVEKSAQQTTTNCTTSAANDWSHGMVLHAQTTQTTKFSTTARLLISLRFEELTPVPPVITVPPVVTLASKVFKVSFSNYVWWSKRPITARAELILVKIGSKSQQMWKPCINFMFLWIVFKLPTKYPGWLIIWPQPSLLVPNIKTET